MKTVIIDYEKCDECCTCISVCADLAMVYTNKLEIDFERCSRCGRCIRVCPYAALAFDKGQENG